MIKRAKEKQKSETAASFDVTRLFALLNNVAAISRDSQSLDAAIPLVLEQVCLYTSWPLGHAYLVAAQADGPQAASSRKWYIDPSIDRQKIQDFVDLSEKTTFKQGVGLIGKVLASLEPVTIPDVTELATFVRAEGARQNGVRGCFAFPVLHDGKPKIILEFFSRDVASLDEATLQVLRFVGNQLNIILARVDYHDHLQSIANSFEVSVKGVVEKTEDYVKLLSGNAEALLKNLVQSEQDAGNAAHSAEQTSGNVQAVADAIEQMAHRIRDISQQIQKSSSLVKECSSRIAVGAERAESLNQSALKVRNSLENINAISGKIKLLSLNARIESARAGEYGRGFSVVANEVKALSTQTEDSVREISEVIAEMDMATQEMMVAMQETRTSILSISEASLTIESAIQEQSQTTETITSNMQLAAETVDNVSANLKNITSAIEESTATSEQVSNECVMLSQQASSLANNVTRFLDQIK